MVNLNGAQQYIHWHFIIITWANVIVIALMIVVFIAALFLPYPGPKHPASTDEETDPARDMRV
jgi:hypothetical protein